MSQLRKRISPFFRFPSEIFLGLVLTVALGASFCLAQGTSSAPPAAGAPPGKPPSDIELVERLMAARHDYQLALEHLRDYGSKWGR